MRYVLVYARPVIGKGSRILFVMKNRPEWQVGKLNLVGGKIDPGETPIEAAVRELKEESGLDPIAKGICIMGEMRGSWGEIYCVKIPVSQQEPVQPREAESEVVFWTDWENVRNHELLIPNLRVIVPLMREGIVGWEIHDEGPDWERSGHTFSITVSSHDKRAGEPIDRI